jgi:catechol 2,3-dioxygenase-like lactoylglutathione lyase family enzyme
MGFDRSIALNVSHVAIKVDDLELTCKFYELILGLKRGPRPAFGYPGAWLADQDGNAIIHLYGGDRGIDSSGAPYIGSGAVDHISINCVGYKDIISALKRVGLLWREFDVPGTTLRQVFVYDPNAILLELTFKKTDEYDELMAQISDEQRYVANQSFYEFDKTREAIHRAINNEH